MRRSLHRSNVVLAVGSLCLGCCRVCCPVRQKTANARHCPPSHQYRLFLQGRRHGSDDSDQSRTVRQARCLRPMVTSRLGLVEPKWPVRGHQTGRLPGRLLGWPCPKNRRVVFVVVIINLFKKLVSRFMVELPGLAESSQRGTRAIAGSFPGDRPWKHYRHQTRRRA